MLFLKKDCAAFFQTVLCFLSAGNAIIPEWALGQKCHADLEADWSPVRPVAGRLADALVGHADNHFLIAVLNKNFFGKLLTIVIHKSILNIYVIYKWRL